MLELFRPVLKIIGAIYAFAILVAGAGLILFFIFAFLWGIFSLGVK